MILLLLGAGLSDHRLLAPFDLDEPVESLANAWATMAAQILARSSGSPWRTSCPVRSAGTSAATAIGTPRRLTTGRVLAVGVSLPGPSPQGTDRHQGGGVDRDHPGRPSSP